MKKVYMALCMMLYFLSCQAQITQVKDMKDIYSYLDDADAKTLAIFDVDMVLVQPSDPAFQMANMKRFSSISKRIMKEIPSSKQMIFFSLMTIHSEPLLIDEEAPRMIQQLVQRGIPAIALTANLTGKLGKISHMETWRVRGLRQLGIDFSKTAPHHTPLVFDNLSSYRGNYSTYQDGVFFVNGTGVSKGEAFLSFLEKIDFYPHKVVFVDDREENLKSLEAAIQKLGRSIEYHGLHYVGAQHYPSKIISEEAFESSWLQLADEAKEMD